MSYISFTIHEKSELLHDRKYARIFSFSPTHWKHRHFLRKMKSAIKRKEEMRKQTILEKLVAFISINHKKVEKVVE